MSFEGYHQFICYKKHYWIEDVYSIYKESFCPKCKRKPIWFNIVDLTNGSFEGKKRIDGYVKINPKKVKIPKNKGHLIKE